MTVDEFFTKYNNKGIDFDGYFGFQCVDLAHQYAVEVVGQDFPGAPAAKDVWNNSVPDKYEKIENSATNVPQKGDIIIWGTAIGAYGHIAVFSSGDENSFTSFDQNWPLNSVCHFQPHNYTGVLGWLHPIATPVPEPVVPTIPEGEELIKTKDLQQLRYKEEVLNDVCDYLGLDRGTVESAKIMKMFDDLKAQIPVEPTPPEPTTPTQDPPVEPIVPVETPVPAQDVPLETPQSQPVVSGKDNTLWTNIISSVILFVKDLFSRSPRKNNE